MKIPFSIFCLILVILSFSQKIDFKLNSFRDYSYWRKHLIGTNLLLLEAEFPLKIHLISYYVSIREDSYYSSFLTQMALEKLLQVSSI